MSQTFLDICTHRKLFGLHTQTQIYTQIPVNTCTFWFTHVNHQTNFSPQNQNKCYTPDLGKGVCDHVKLHRPHGWKHTGSAVACSVRCDVSVKELNLDRILNNKRESMTEEGGQREQKQWRLNLHIYLFFSLNQKAVLVVYWRRNE